MKIHRSRPAGRFTIVPNATARDPRLSHIARGVLLDLLSRPYEWQASADAMWKAGRHARGRKAEGRDALRAAFIELETCGYLQRARKRTLTGRIATELHVYDVPAGGTDDGTSSPRSDLDEQASSQVAPTTDLQASVRPAETGIVAGRTDDGTGGTSVPPAETPVCPGRTDDGTSRRLYEDLLQRPQDEYWKTPETEGQGQREPLPHDVLTDQVGGTGSNHGTGTGARAREEPPGPNATEAEIAAWQVAESRRQRAGAAS